jgi:nucleotide-binding universal stress UspA family protein
LETHKEFQKLLVAFDGSEDSKKAIKTACSLGKVLGSKLMILHVYTVPVYAYAGPGGVPPISIDSLEGAAKARAAAVVGAGLELAKDEGVEASGETLQSGSVVEAIVDYAAKENVQLVVIGTRGMTGFKRMLLGSVSVGVVAHAHCPVMVVR